MPKSLKVKFKSLRNRFLIDDAEYQSMCKKLDGHDKELIDKVSDRIKDDYGDCDEEDGCQKCMFSRYGKIDCVLDTVINELKSEIREVR